jgi:hypothetical protein
MKTTIEKLQEELKEIGTRMPASPVYTFNDREKDAATALAWHESFQAWAATFDAKMNELDAVLRTEEFDK